MSQTNYVFTLTLLIIALGYGLKHFNFVSEKDGKTISKFLMHTTFPALMISSVSKIQLNAGLSLIPLFAVFCIGTMLIMAYVLFANSPNVERGILTMACGSANVGLFGFPLIEGLLGKDSLIYAIMFDFGNTFVVFGASYSVGIYFSANHTGFSAKHILRRVFSSPPFLGLFLGLFINLSEIELPRLCSDFLDTLAKANKPLVLLLMGIYLSFKLDKAAIKNIAKALGIRYAIGLLVVGILFYFCEPSTMRSVLMICTLLPLGMTILPFSDELGYDSRIAGTTLNISLIISFLLIWGLALFGF